MMQTAERKSERNMMMRLQAYKGRLEVKHAKQRRV